MKKIFKAKIYHKRFLPTINEFVYSGLYIKFSIDQVSELQSKFFSINRFNLFSFYERDHGYRDGSSLRKWAQNMLKQAGVDQFNGEIVLQTFPRVLGYVFNPVSFWFCYEREKMIAVIAEVNNTFGESHNYVILNDSSKDIKVLKKEFHVSPFYDVKGSYLFNFKIKDKVQIDYCFDETLQLTTSLVGKEIAWNDKELLKLFFKNPFYTFFVVVLIHYEALRLFLKKNKFYSKPPKKNKELTYE